MAPHDFNFQYFVNMVKQKTIAWPVFVKLMEDLSYLDVNRLKYLNATLLTELTMSYSDLDRMKYLNVILMSKFKDAILSEDNFEESNREDISQMSVIDHGETNKEKSSDGEIQILSIEENEINENFDSPIHKNMDFTKG